MIPLSVAIVTLNEESNLRRCLESIKWADEIVVVDSGSTDRTKEICLSYGCKFIESPWLGFGKTKQLAVANTTHDWVLSIDSDEEITPLLKQEIIALLQTEPAYQGYRIKRDSFYLGKIIRHCGWNKDYTLRLFNKQNGNFNDKIVHEFVDVKGRIAYLKNTMLHYTYPTLDSHINKMTRYARLGAEQIQSKGRKATILTAIIRGKCKFLKMYFLQSGFLDGREGFLLSLNSGWGVYLKYITLWEMNKSK
jgi:glycosyltransferase involved in cell wall biosynthesis